MTESSPHPRFETRRTPATAPAPWLAAELVRIEAGRFKLGLVERLIFEAVNALTTGLGRAALRVDRNWASLADAIQRPRNHVGATVRGPRGLVMHGVLSCGADDGGYALAVNYDFERWSYEVLASHGAHWAAQNRLRRANGCTELLWPPEEDLRSAMAQSHRERWSGRALAIVERDALRFGGQPNGVMSAGVVPDSGSFPESGSESAGVGEGGAEVGFTRVNIERNAPTRFLEKCRSLDARPRALDPMYKGDSNPIGSKVVQSSMSLEVVKGRLRSGDYHDFINAARAIIGPAWEPRPEWPKGDAGKWVGRYNVGGPCRELVLRVMESLIEDGWQSGASNGALAQERWERWGGPSLDKKLHV